MIFRFIRAFEYALTVEKLVLSFLIVPLSCDFDLFICLSKEMMTENDDNETDDVTAATARNNGTVS